MVQEMAERIVKLEKRTSGKLWARCSADGPQSLDELRVLLGRNGMWAAAWLLEKVRDELEDANADADEADELKEKLDDAEGKLTYIHKLTTSEKENDNEPTTSRTD
jgi:hypothetical protein